MLISRHRLAILATVALIILSYTAAGFWGVPLLARSQLHKFAEQTLHRQLSLGAVQFNPFTLELKVNELELKDTSGTPLLGFRQLYVDAALASVWERRINLQQVQLDAPAINVAIDESGNFNLAGLLPANGQAATKTAVPDVRIGLFAISQGRIALSDLSQAAAYKTELQQITADLQEFRTDAGHLNVYKLSAQTALKEQVEMSGEFAVQPQSMSGRFAIRQLQLAPLASYLPATLPFRVAGGVLSLEGHYQLAAAASSTPAPTWQLSLNKVSAENFAIAAGDAASSRPVLMIPTIAINDVQVAPKDRTITIKDTLLLSPALEVSRNAEGVLNLSRMLISNSAQAPLGSVPLAAENNRPANSSSNQSPAESPWQFTILATRIEAGVVNVMDDAVTPAAHFAVQPVSLQIANLGTGPDAMHFKGTAVIDKDAHLTLEGDFRLAQMQAGVDFSLDGFALSALQPYLAQQTQLRLKSGVFALHGRVDYTPIQTATADTEHASNDNSPLTFSGEISVDNLHTADKNTGIEFVDWKLLEVKGIRVAINADSSRLTRVDIDSISAEQAYANVQIAADQTINAARMFSASGPQDASASRPQVHIDTIKIIDSAADFADLSIEPNFSTGIVDLNGAISGLSSRNAARAKVVMQGKVDRYSPVDINGEINPFAAKSFSDLSVKFSNIDLTTFNPYSGKYAGYNITKGKLSAEMRYQIVDSKLDAQHHVIVNNLEFGNKTDSKDAAPIPLKLAIALLKDSRGVITADLPVSGTLDDPQFRLAPLVWKALVGLLGNVASAPFAALGRLFGGGDELAFVEFEPGSIELNTAQSDKLTTLAKALIERPGLSLNIPVNSTSTADADALARQALQALAPAASDSAARTTYLTALELEYKNRSGQPMSYAASQTDAASATAEAPLDQKIALLEQALLPLLKPGPDALADLGRRRGEAVEAKLLGNSALQPERIFLISDESTAARQQGKSTAAAIKMEMHLQ